MVATSAFGMGINKPNIRNIIRYGVPENVCSWAQELGRAGRDNLPAKATIFYSRTNIEHANAWIKGHLHNQEHCSRILEEFSAAWRYVMSNLAQKCRRATLLELFGEESIARSHGSVCCDVCENSTESIQFNCIQELKILYDAMRAIGPKGELKLSQWIRGSRLAWTESHNKGSMSYSNFNGHSENWWREFIRQCHVLGLVNKELRSIIKKNRHYGIQGIICETVSGRKCIEQDQELLMTRCRDEPNATRSLSKRAMATPGQNGQKRVRSGKGSHGVAVIKQMLEDEENWEIISCKGDYQFPGVFSTSKYQRAYYTTDCMSLPQSTSNPHFLWDDIQLSKSGWNKDRRLDVEIGGKNEALMYRVSSCNGVKVCPESSCDYVVPFSAQRSCSAHPSNKLIKTKERVPCPVNFAYLYPQNVSVDNRRWLFAFVRGQSEASLSLHNHKIHGSSKVCLKVKEMISNAVQLNPSLKPSEIFKGKGINAVPGAIDKSSTHIGKISNVVKKCRLQAMAGTKWEVEHFEDVADEMDKKDEELTGNNKESLHLRKLMRPYLVSTGREDGIKFIFCMSPLMCSLLAESEFIEADITYNESREYRYLFNAVTFNYTTMDWMVVSRVRMDQQTAAAYGLAYSKMFAKCKSMYPTFQPGETLLGIVVDWSDAVIKGLGFALGKEKAMAILRGCKVHWARSWQRVRDRVAMSANKKREKALFSLIASEIPNTPAGNDLERAFAVLCKEKTSHSLVGVIKGFTTSDADFIDVETNWSTAKKWVEWWMRPNHIKLLHKDYSKMRDDIWEKCPSDTNAVERKNLDSKECLPQAIQAALINMYKYDKAACAKHIAAMEGTSISYIGKNLEIRKKQNIKRSIHRQNSPSYDKLAQYGPPDRQCHFEESTSRKRSAEQTSEAPSSKNPKILPSDPQANITANDKRTSSAVKVQNKYIGRRLQVRFCMEISGSHEWFDGEITSYNSESGLHGVFFPCDGQTIHIDLVKEEDDIIFYK